MSIRSWISQIGDLDLVPVFVKVSLITVNYVLGFTSAGRWLDGRAGEGAFVAGRCRVLNWNRDAARRGRGCRRLHKYRALIRLTSVQRAGVEVLGSSG